MRITRVLGAFVASCVLVFPAAGIRADEIYIYPSKGQSEQQQDKDKAECYAWAKEQTGFNPIVGPPTPPAATPKPKGIGPAANRKKRAWSQANADAQNQFEAAAAAYKEGRGKWERAAKACLTGRGYTIS